MNSPLTDRFAALFAHEGSKRIWAVVAFVIALGLLLSFYGVVTAVAKRDEEQKTQATQQAHVFWRCIELQQAEERRACHERNATSPDRPAAAQPAPNAAQFAGLKS
jgi:uncharacterized protein HemX